MLVINRVFITFPSASWHVLNYCVTQLLGCVWLCDVVECSMPGSSGLHYLPGFAQIHVHSVDDAIWTSHPLVLSFPFVFSLSWVSQVAQVENLPAMQETCTSHGFNPWVRKIPWRRKWQHTPIFWKIPGRL